MAHVGFPWDLAGTSLGNTSRCQLLGAGGFGAVHRGWLRGFPKEEGLWGKGGLTLGFLLGIWHPPPPPRKRKEKEAQEDTHVLNLEDVLNCLSLGC